MSFNFGKSKKTPLDANKYDTSGKSIWTKFVQALNNFFNPAHAWYDYSTWKDKSEGNLDNWLAGTTGSGLTAAQRATNAFNAEEAEKQRLWEEEMSSTSWQRGVADMQKAGINPALAMGQGGASTPSGSAASGASPSTGQLPFELIMQAIMLPLQRKLLQSQAKLADDQGAAALMQGQAALRNAGANEQNAGTNARNAGTREGELDVARYEAETRRMLKDIEQERLDVYRGMTEEQKKVLSAQAAFLNLQREQLPKQLELAEKNADSQSKQAIASLRQAEAAVQNAATNDRLSDYQTSLMYAQETLEWYKGDGQAVINKYLDDRQRTELDNLVKEGVRIDKQGRLYDKTGRYMDSQMVRNYVESACSVSNAVNKWINPLSGMTSAMPSDWTIGNSIAPGAGIMMSGGI